MDELTATVFYFATRMGFCIEVLSGEQLLTSVREMSDDSEDRNRSRALAAACVLAEQHNAAQPVYDYTGQQDEEALFGATALDAFLLTRK